MDQFKKRITLHFTSTFWSWLSQIEIWLNILTKCSESFTATLNHLAANINQIAKKRNSFDELNAIERAELQVLSNPIKQLANDIKSQRK